MTKWMKAEPRAPIDELDRRLLVYLQSNARASTAALARRFKLSGPGLQKRLKKLEERGVIHRYATIVSRQAVVLDLLCFVHVMLANHRPNSIRRVFSSCSFRPNLAIRSPRSSTILRPSSAYWKPITKSSA